MGRTRKRRIPLVSATGGFLAARRAMPTAHSGAPRHSDMTGEMISANYASRAQQTQPGEIGRDGRLREVSRWRAECLSIKRCECHGQGPQGHNDNETTRKK